MAKRKTPEGYLLDVVTDYLAAKRILAFRQQTGASVSEYKGRTRLIRYGTPGMADIQAIQRREGYGAFEGRELHRIFWIECKAPNGTQSPLQKSFQQMVEAEGHTYVLAYGIEDLEAAGL